jgi:hercynylcysteine S-oxide lyase
MRSTLPTSHGFIPKNADIGSPFPKSAFVDAGRSAFVCIPTAIKWRESLGGEEVVRQYCWTLAQEGGKYLAAQFGTKVMDNSTKTLTRCCMVNVELPISATKAYEAAAQNGIVKEDVGGAVRDWMGRTAINDYNTFMQTLFYGGAWWARLSGQVYLEMEDIVWAAKTLKEICERVERGEWATPASKL